MPLYNYKCSRCQEIYEFNKKISDRDDTESLSCPECLQTGYFTRLVAAPLIGYSIATSGYGRGAGDGWKEVLRKIDAKSPGSRMKETSSFL